MEEVVLLLLNFWKILISFWRGIWVFPFLVRTEKPSGFYFPLSLKLTLPLRTLTYRLRFVFLFKQFRLCCTDEYLISTLRNHSAEREKREVISALQLHRERSWLQGTPGCWSDKLGAPCTPCPHTADVPLAGNASSALTALVGTRHIPEMYSRKQSWPFLHPAHLCKGLPWIFTVGLARWEFTIVRMKWK